MNKAQTPTIEAEYASLDGKGKLFLNDPCSPRLFFDNDSAGLNSENRAIQGGDLSHGLNRIFFQDCDDESSRRKTHGPMSLLMLSKDSN